MVSDAGPSSPHSPAHHHQHRGDEQAGGGGLEATWRRAWAAGSRWADKDDLLDVVYWLRQLAALLMGAAWAAAGVRGVAGLGAYVVASTLMGHFYVTQFQRVDEDTVGGAWELAKEGFGSAFATFMICWIVGHSALYFP